MKFFPWLYDLVMVAADRTPIAQWRRSVVAPARGRILEIAAGTGLNFGYYGCDASVIATDVDPEMLRRARHRAGESRGHILLVAADAEMLPFRVGTFDEAVVGLALCTIPHPEAALLETRRVLRAGAPVRLLEHVRVAHPLVGRLQDFLTPLWRRVAGGCRLNRRTEETIVSSGFRLEGVRRHAHGLVLAIQARADSGQRARR